MSQQNDNSHKSNVTIGAQIAPTTFELTIKVSDLPPQISVHIRKNLESIASAVHATLVAQMGDLVRSAGTTHICHPTSKEEIEALNQAVHGKKPSTLN